MRTTARAWRLFATIVPILLSPGSTGCSNEKAHSGADDLGTGRRAGLDVQGRSVADSLRLEALVDSLPLLRGEFTNPLPGRWDFSGDRRYLIAFERFGDSAVVTLTQCLDRADSAAATFQGRRVLAGFMCYAALTRVAYYEWDQEPEQPALWLGIVPADATPRQLRAAKEAWTEVVRTKRYVLHEQPGGS